MEVESLRDLLRTYRRSMGWTQEQAALHLNYSVETVSAWERGKRKPNMQEIPKLAKLLGLETTQLAHIIRKEQPQAKSQQGRSVREHGADWQAAYETWGELVHIYRNRTEFNHAFSYVRMLEQAHHVVAVGISLNGIALNYSQETLVNSILDRGCTYELCFLDPDGQNCREREREENLVEGTIMNFTRTNIFHMRNLQRRVRDLRTSVAEHLQLSTYDLPPRYNIYIVDDSIMTVQTYGYGRGEDTPTLVLQRQGTSGLFQFYATAVRYTLEKARLLPVEEVPASQLVETK